MNFDTTNFSITISNFGSLKKHKGYFESHEYGEDLGGELIFKDLDLIDYDGVYNLPTEIKILLNTVGYNLSQIR